MKAPFRKLVAVLALSGMCVAQSAATSGAATKKSAKKTTTSTAEELKQLRQMLEQQQQQIQQMQQQMQQRDQQLQQAQQKLDEAHNAAQQAQQQAQTAQASATEAAKKSQDEVEDVRGTLTSTIQSMQDEQKARNESIEHPTSLRYKGITITPGGFIAAEGLWRQHNESADVISTFNGLPYNGATATNLTEFRFTARQSRLSLLAEGKAGNVKLTGYYEMDFLGAAPTANENQSTSFNIRQRILFGQAEMPKGWTFTAGQTWSLITNNKIGIATRGEWVPATIDGQYLPGYDFTRAMTVRVTKTLANKKAAFAFALENPESLIGGLNIPSYVAYNAPGTGALGNGVNYSVDLSPDMIVKAAFDPGWGHYEIKGIGRVFRDRVVPNGTTIPTSAGTNNSTWGGGIGFGLMLPLKPKKVDFVADGLWGKGVARYTDSSNVDAIIRPNGDISPVMSGSALAGVETHFTPKLDWYTYFGGEYLGQNQGAMADLTGTVKQFGYGNPNLDLSGCYKAEASFSCPANFKNILQGTTGFWYRFYKGPYGTLQTGLQYSYTHKSAWGGLNGLNPVVPRGTENIVLTSFRYYLP